MHGQSAKFRVVKYIVIFAVGGVVYWWGGWGAAARTLGVALVFAIVTHFFFRWKSKGWNEDFGPYKSLFKK